MYALLSDKTDTHKRHQINFYQTKGLEKTLYRHNQSWKYELFLVQTFIIQQKILWSMGQIKWISDQGFHTLQHQKQFYIDLAKNVTHDFTQMFCYFIHGIDTYAQNKASTCNHVLFWVFNLA